MSAKFNRGIKLTLLVLMLFLSAGCTMVTPGIITTVSDEAMIEAIADNIKTAIENKDVDLFMDNISKNYSDSFGQTYESIRIMALDLVGEIEAAEDLANSYGANIVLNTFISNLIIVESWANSDFQISINANILFFNAYSYDIAFEVNFQKENGAWKVLSIIEKS